MNWISVKNALPPVACDYVEDHCKVLVVSSVKGFKPQYMVAFMMIEEGYDSIEGLVIEWREDTHSAHNISQVTHWMHLPKEPLL